MEIKFSGEVWHWRGPSPYHFVTVPDAESVEVEATSALVSYGWGMIPVTAQIGGTGWSTSLWPKEGRYIVPLKDHVRKAEAIEIGDTVTIRLTIDLGRGPGARH
jgi:hypothetical protein